MVSTKKIKIILQIIRYLPYTIFFNFRHLPFSQASKLPILLYKPKILSNNGKYEIIGKIRFGMIRLGFPNVSIFPNNGITLENRGVVIFGGRCRLGNDSAISVGSKGYLSIGNDVFSSCGLKLVCYHKIDIGNMVRIGWNIICMDTDFHSMKSVDGGNKSKGYGSITISDHTWIASFCKIYKHTFVPEWCTVSSNTILKQIVEAPPYSVIYNPIQIDSKYIARYRDPYDDRIDYQ